MPCNLNQNLRYYITKFIRSEAYRVTVRWCVFLRQAVHSSLCGYMGKTETLHMTGQQKLFQIYVSTLSLF